MTTYIARRLIQTLIVIILVSFIIFFVIRLLPGDPLQIYLASSSDNIQNISPETLATLRHQFGLDKPVVIQYFNWLWGIVTRGDFGTSIIQQTDVSKLMKERFPVTIYLGILAFIVGYGIGYFRRIVGGHQAREMDR